MLEVRSRESEAIYRTISFLQQPDYFFKDISAICLLHTDFRLPSSDFYLYLITSSRPTTDFAGIFTTS